jgi:hypothetical protein
MAKRDRSSASNLGRRAVVFEEHEVVRLVRLAVEREGGQSAFAKRHGVDRVFINMILNGKRRVSDSVAKALGLRKLFVAEWNSFAVSKLRSCRVAAPLNVVNLHRLLPRTHPRDRAANQFAVGSPLYSL